MPRRETPRDDRSFMILGALLTALLHLGVIGGFWLARARADSKPPLGPGVYVDAALVKFGKPRDLSFLPHKVGAVKTVGPPTGLKIATSDRALPHLDKETPPPDKSDPLKNTHADQFKNLTDQPEGVDNSGEGSPTGSKAGTATEARGDPYVLSLIDQIGTAWNVPTTIKDAELATLSADVCLQIDNDGGLKRFDFTRKSGNSQFDSSLEATLGLIKKLPPPPDRFRGKRLCPTFSKEK